MIGQLRRYVKSRAIRTARKAYDQARAAYEDACARRDTRDKHTTHAAFTKAASELLKAETSVRLIRR